MYHNLLTVAQKPPHNLSEEELDVYSHIMLAVVDHDYYGKTQALFNAVFRELHMEGYGYTMAIGATERVDEIYHALRSDVRYQGGGVGSGFKEKILPYLDSLDPHARALGSVNHVVRLSDNLLKGFNTDGLGYVAGLEQVMEERNHKLEGSMVVMLGAGGTAPSIGFALAERCAHIIILNRTVEKSERLAKRINDFSCRPCAAFGGEEDIPNALAHADVVVNVSKKGDLAGGLAEFSALAPASDISKEGVNRNHEESRRILETLDPKKVIVSDIILRETPTLSLAREAGLTVQDGRPMNLNQAVAAFMLSFANVLDRYNADEGHVREIMSRTLEDIS